MDLESQERNKDKGNFFVRYLLSFKHAVDGLWYLFKFEHNIIIILFATIVTTILGLVLNISSIEWIVIVLCYGLVLAAEMINSAIEATVDLITLKTHPLAKLAKDTASSATLVLCIMSLVIGLIIFIPKIGG